MGICRIYCRQWLPFYTSAAMGEDGKAECEREFRQRYRGTVDDGDWRIEAPAEGFGRSFLHLHVPNLAGEFTREDDAWEQAGRDGHRGHPHQVVPAGGPDERKLLAYGTRRHQ